MYRFFDSKKAINAGVARRLMGEVEHASQVIATRPRGATERLRELLETVHRMNSDRYAGNSKMHEMVAAAMEENWDVCKAHIDCIIGVTRSVIADGVASGEFHTSDVGVAALCTCSAMMALAMQLQPAPAVGISGINWRGATVIAKPRRAFAKSPSVGCRASDRLHVRTRPVGEVRESARDEGVGSGDVPLVLGAKVRLLREVLEHLAHLMGAR